MNGLGRSGMKCPKLQYKLPSLWGPPGTTPGLDTQGRKGKGRQRPRAARVFPPKPFPQLGEVNLLMPSNLLPSVGEPTVLIKNCGQL